MNRLVLYILPGLVLGLLLLQTGCSDLENISSPELSNIIKSVVPAHAPSGARVMIGGLGFGTDKEQVEVYFDKAKANIEALSDSSILTRVPRKANTGPIKVVARGDTLTGPTFTVDASRNLWLQVTDITPDEGRYGDRVEIRGNGFHTEPKGNEVLFGNVTSKVDQAADTLLVVRVPEQALSGPVLVVVNQDTAVGPAFTVNELSVQKITPTSGAIGSEVKIFGNGFSNELSENKVRFNGVVTEPLTASETELLVRVPEEATSGPVTITVNNYVAEGPLFTIQEPKSLLITVLTEGTNQDDEYLLSVTDAESQKIMANDERVYNDLYSSEVQVKLSDVASNCRVDVNNPRTISLSTERMAEATFYVDCTKDVRGDIVYTSDLNSFSDIFVKDEKSSEIIQLTETTDINENNPVISPDGLQIAFDAYTEAGSHIFVMDSDGSDVTQVTHTGYNFKPDWSPEGDRIIFEGGMEIMDIKIINLESERIENVTSTVDASERSPNWSPNSDEIAFVEYDGADVEIYIIRTDGTGKRQVTDNVRFDSEPEWSPVRDEIVFLSENTDGLSVVKTINSDGSSSRQLPNTVGAKSSVTWSPDGNRVALSMNYDGVDQIFIYSIEEEMFIQTPFIYGNDRTPHWNYK